MFTRRPKCEIERIALICRVTSTHGHAIGMAHGLLHSTGMEEAMNESYAPSLGTEAGVDAPDATTQTAEEERLAAPIEKRTIVMVGAALIVLPFVLYAGAAFFIPL